MNYLIITIDSFRGSWGKGKTIAEAAQNAEIDLDDDCEYNDPITYRIYECEHENFWCNQNGSLGWNGARPKMIHEGIEGVQAYVISS